MNSDQLRSLFLEPRSVAFIGVPRKSGPGSLNPVDHLKRWGYQGEIFLVHPQAKEIAGLPVHKNIADVPAKVDLAVVSTPRETVPQVIGECARKGISAVIVTNQGFSEADARGAELQKAMLDEAARGRVRILGPNTLGVTNAFHGFTTSFMPLDREEPPVGLICQSGVFFVGSAGFLGGMGIGVDVGNACDLDMVDALEWLGFDPRLKVVAIHAEEISRGRRLIEVARKVTGRIPVVALKTGRSPAGARAAATHSGSMAGEDRIADAVIRSGGIIRVNDSDELLDVVQGFVRLPPMRGRRVAVVTLSGAGGIMLLDAMHAWGLSPAVLSNETLAPIQELSPPWMPLGNPLDIWPALMKHGMKRVYRKALAEMLKDPAVDAVICLALALRLAEQAHLGVVEIIQELSEKANKPVVTWFYGPDAALAGAQVMSHGRAVPIASLERAVRLLTRMAQYEEWKTKSEES